VNLRALRCGAIIWKTLDPAVNKRLEHSFSRDVVLKRTPVDAEVYAHVGQCLTLSVRDRATGHAAAASWDKVLQPAEKFPLTEDLARQQLGRLGDTPFELGALTIDASGGPMVPKSVLNDLRRQAVEALLAARAARAVHAIAAPDALQALRRACAAPGPAEAPQPPPPARLHLLVRTLEQLDAALAWESPSRPETIYCDFEDIRRYRDAVARCRSAGRAVALATLRIVKPGEEGILRSIAAYAPDALLVRNLAAVAFCREQFPHIPLIGDSSLNVANELTAGLFARRGLVRIVPSYDLNWKQLAAMLRRSDPGRFECVVHQHMPMFHMEHCVFAHTLSAGRDYRDCGRPCEKHAVDLRDRVGQAHPLIPDVGCRNTVFNAQAQSAMQYLPRMRELGIGHFRIELLRESAAEVPGLLDRYAQVLAGRREPRQALRSLRVLNQLGVTPGTLVHE
jgi:putative protease